MSVGLRGKVLADIFNVSTTTVSRVIITWANFLYLVLGSLPIWMTKEQVRATMPAKFKEYFPDVRVILDCTEIRCENSTALTVGDVFTLQKLPYLQRLGWCCSMWGHNLCFTAVHWIHLRQGDNKTVWTFGTARAWRLLYGR